MNDTPTNYTPRNGDTTLRLVRMPDGVVLGTVGYYSNGRRHFVNVVDEAAIKLFPAIYELQGIDSEGTHYYRAH
jgi:hypothetical protein